MIGLGVSAGADAAGAGGAGGGGAGGFGAAGFVGAAFLGADFLGADFFLAAAFFGAAFFFFGAAFFFGLERRATFFFFGAAFLAFFLDFDFFAFFFGRAAMIDLLTVYRDPGESASSASRARLRAFYVAFAILRESFARLHTSMSAPGTGPP